MNSDPKPILLKDGFIIDGTHKTITPGFIDMHSHNDWFLPNAARPELTTPFTEQGITTFVGGNCGFSAAGLVHGKSPGKLYR